MMVEYISKYSTKRKKVDVMTWLRRIKLIECMAASPQ